MERIFLTAAHGVLQSGSVTMLITHQCPGYAEEGLHSSCAPLPQQDVRSGDRTQLGQLWSELTKRMSRSCGIRLSTESCGEQGSMGAHLWL